MKKKYIIFSIIILVLLITFITSYNYFKTTNTYVEDNIKNQTKITKGISMNLEQTAGAGDYKTVTQSNWPTDGYKFNTELSRCENGSELSWDDTKKAVIVSGNLSDKCYVYFDIIKNFATICKDETDLYNCYNNKKEYFTEISSLSGPYEGLFRYYGKDVDNYVSLDGILFRIIGITDGSRTNTNVGLNKGQLKLIKPEIIDNSAWNNTFDDKILNNSSIIPTNWLDKITSQKYYDDDVDSSGYAPGFTETKKLSLMYVSDIYYSVKDGPNFCYANGTCENSWLNNGVSEWTASRAGFETTWFVYYFNSNGKVMDDEEGFVYARRLVFYLKPSIKIVGGMGTKTNPYKLADSGNEYEIASEPVPPKIKSTVVNFSSTITVSATDENGLASYCINQNSTDTNDCNWINNTSMTWTTAEITKTGDYYLHVKNVDGLIAHSSKLTIKAYKETLYSNILAISPKGLASTVKYGMYRFVGEYQNTDAEYAGKVDNYICLGTNNKTTCLNNADKYMYRIIGLVKSDDTGTNHLEGQIKVIKNTSVGLYKWDGGKDDSEGLVNYNNWNVSNVWMNKVVVGNAPCNITTAENRCSITWNQSLLNYDATGNVYSLNGPSNSFASSVDFNDIVVSSKWHNPKAINYSIDEELSSNNITSEHKYGLIYYVDSIEGGTWLKNTGYTLFNLGIQKSTSDYKFTVISTKNDDYYAWISNNKWDEYGCSDVKPVFYLNPYVNYGSGNGTYSNPFILS